MKKINIVKETKDFEKAIQQGSFQKNKHYILYKRTTETGYYRFGISVGKKISNKAVVLNRIKSDSKID